VRSIYTRSSGHQESSEVPLITSTPPFFTPCPTYGSQLSHPSRKMCYPERNCKQILDYRIGEFDPQELIGRGTSGQHMRHSISGEETIRFPPAPGDRNLCLKAFHERNQDEKRPSSAHSKVTPPSIILAVSLIWRMRLQGGPSRWRRCVASIR